MKVRRTSREAARFVRPLPARESEGTLQVPLDGMTIVEAQGSLLIRCLNIAIDAIKGGNDAAAFAFVCLGSLRVAWRVGVKPRLGLLLQTPPLQI